MTDCIRIIAVSATKLPDTWAATLEANGACVRYERALEGVAPTARDWQADVVVVDQGWDDDEVASAVARLRDIHPCTTALVVAAYTPRSFTRTFQAGADLCVQRDAPAADLLRALQQELRHRDDPAPSHEARQTSVAHFVGNSRQMRDVCQMIARAAPSTASVFIGGESGTGKELVARAIHRLSPRRARPFVAVNCGAIPESLLESELFGHEVGAFTGATARRQGRFEQADTGTLFLDEIGELPRAMQVKLLRVLQEHSFERLGGMDTVSVDVRVLAATNQDITAQIERGEFRRDLFYRLNVLQIDLPPLRDRLGDLPGLWRYFLREAADAEALAPPQTDADVLRMLYRYDWPGNVRELNNVARHAVTMSSGHNVTPGRLPLHFASQLTSADIPDDHVRLPGMTLAEVERVAILETFRGVGSVKETAELLGISERKVYYRLKEYRNQGHLSVDESDNVEQTSGAATAAPAPSDQARRPRLIVAEDDEQIRWALKKHLESEFDVTTVPNGRALVDQARAHRPDIILSDVRMPGLDGIQVLRELHNESWDIPVVLITAYGDEATRAQADMLGAVALLDKPINMSRLRSELRNAIAVQ